MLQYRYVIAQNKLLKGNHILTITMKSNSNKKQNNLPWWVEILFVQIGLPDSWLSKYLKKKKETIKFINENRKNIFYCALLVSGVIYIYPTVRYTSLSNSCIDKTSEYLSSNNNENSKTEIDIRSLSVSYCHGGALPK